MVEILSEKQKVPVFNNLGVELTHDFELNELKGKKLIEELVDEQVVQDHWKLFFGEEVIGPVNEAEVDVFKQKALEKGLLLNHLDQVENGLVHLESNFVCALAQVFVEGLVDEVGNGEEESKKRLLNHEERVFVGLTVVAELQLDQNGLLERVFEFLRSEVRPDLIADVDGIDRAHEHLQIVH